VAKAEFFPSITLTAAKGSESSELSKLMTAGTGIWSVGASVVRPVFEGGRMAKNVQLTELQKEETVLEYTKAVQQAFNDVVNALTAIDKTRAARLEQENFTQTLEDQERLANLRYEGGVTPYLEVLDTDRQYLDARRGLAQAKRDELLSVLALYKALGGGWQGATEGGKEELP